MSSFATLLQIFTEPGQAMERVRERSMVWLPLLLLVFGTAAIQAWYYQAVDFAWLQDLLLSANADIDPAQREAARGFMSRGVLMGSAVIGTIIIIPLILAISAVYYLLAAKVIGNELGFGKWFAFVTWTSVPTLLMLPASAVQILLNSDGQLPPDAMNPLSLNQLFFHLPMGHPWAGLLNALNVLTIWSIVVAVIGYRRWTGKGLGTSVFIVLLPYLLVFGGWALFVAATSP